MTSSPPTQHDVVAVPLDSHRLLLHSPELYHEGHSGLLSLAPPGHHVGHCAGVLGKVQEGP